MSLLKNTINIDHFDIWSKTYDQGPTKKWFQYVHQLVINQMNLKENNRVLDVGCGTGLAITKISTLLPKGKVCGIDISRGMVEKSKQKVMDKANIELKVADAERIPYPSDYFDYVFSTHSFHHYSEPVAALNEMKRVLKQGRPLLIAESCRNASIGARLFDYYHRFFEKGHIMYYSEEELIELYEQAGFLDVRIVFLESNYFKY